MWHTVQYNTVQYSATRYGAVYSNTDADLYVCSRACGRNVGGDGAVCVVTDGGAWALPVGAVTDGVPAMHIRDVSHTA